MIAKLKQHYLDWKERRFLRKHGCETRAQYDYRFDPDYNNRASRVKDYYHGYEFVYCIEPDGHYAYKVLFDFGPGGYRTGENDIWDWCIEHCEGKWRADYLRVLKNYWGEWEINEIGGGDYLFWAFQNEMDYMNFLLRWSGVSR